MNTIEFNSSEQSHRQREVVEPQKLIGEIETNANLGNVKIAQQADREKAEPVFAKTGYIVPKQIAAQYVAHDGKFIDRKSETVRFEDKGKSLTTDSNDRKVISHMVEIAKAKNWGLLELKGTEEFRRQAWISAQIAGMETRGFLPKAQDHALLEVARQEMRISGTARPKSLETGHSAMAVDNPVPDRPANTGLTHDYPVTASAPVGIDPASVIKQVQEIREERAREIQSEARTIAGTHHTSTPAELSRKAWVAAELAGIQTVGYEPDECARELLEATRKEIYTRKIAPSVNAAQLVMEQNLKGMPASVQERCRAEFSTTIVNAPELDLPPPKASERTIEAARRAFFERSAVQPSQATGPAKPDRTQDDPSMEIIR